MIGLFDYLDYYSLMFLFELFYVVMLCNYVLLCLLVVMFVDLVSQDIILGDIYEWEEYCWCLVNLFSVEGILLNIIIEVLNILVLLGLVVVGLGVIVYFESLIGFLGCSVEVCLIIYLQFCISIVLVWKWLNWLCQVCEFVEVVKLVGMCQCLGKGWNVVLVLSLQEFKEGFQYF